MSKHDTDARRNRFYKIERLYRSGQTFEQIAEKLNPPVSTQRAWQLLREGASLGLYPQPKRRNRTKERLSEISEGDVREAYRKTESISGVARILSVRRSVLGKHFQSLFRELRDGRDRQRVIDDYRAITEKLGHEPSVTEVGPMFYQRISIHFGSYASFYEAMRADAHFSPSRKCAFSERS